MQSKLRILVDMDNTILDFLGRVEEMWLSVYPNRPVPTSYSNWRFNEDYEILYPGSGSEIIDLYHGKDCFNLAKPIDGAIKALNEMLEAGHDVFICTAPVAKYEHCVRDKYFWVEKHLGKEWLRRLILTPDKTFVSADIIIDDKPEITGIQSPPLWEHILYTQTYNLNIDKKRIDSWSEWRSVIEKYCLSKSSIPQNAKIASGIIPIFEDEVLLGMELRVYNNTYSWMEFGGKQEKGETIAETALRETNEETARTLALKLHQVLEAESKGHYIDNYNVKSNFFYRMYCVKLEGEKPLLESFRENSVGRDNVGKIDWNYFKLKDVLESEDGTLPGTDAKLYSTMMVRISRLRNTNFINEFLH